MKRRHFLIAVSAAPVGLACSRAFGDDGDGAERWPGPTRPVSRVANRPPQLGDQLVLSDIQWRRRLTREQYGVLREGGTEAPFSGTHWDEHRDGTYYCGGCGAPLFASSHKFESGTGWPSFDRPINPRRVGRRADRSHGMARVEVHCARCQGHLGHIFPDGPPTTNDRYCINSVSLHFLAT